MIVEFTYHLLQFDSAWITEFILNNLGWGFAFFALAHIFYEGKKVASRFVILMLVPWFTMDMTNVSGMVTYVAAFLSLYYLGEISLMKFAEDDPKFKDKLIWVEEGWFFTVLILFNFILGAAVKII